MLKKWGPSLINFNIADLRSYSYHRQSERDSMLSGGHFINEIFTYKPNSDGTVGNVTDPLNERYIQAAFFDKYPYNSSPPYPYSKYFMIVNR